MEPIRRCRVGIVGYGSLGQFLVDRILNDAKAAAALELVFVWNRSADKLAAGSVPLALQATDLDAALEAFAVDLIVEVAHPAITRSHGAAMLRKAHYYMGSPTGLADTETHARLAAAAVGAGHKLLVPVGALWGAHDIKKMADRGSLAALTVTMKKHPSSLKVEGALVPLVEAAIAEDTPGGDPLALASVSKERVIFEGSVRDLCPLAPNNVNTMAAAAIAGHTLGFDGVRARLVADAALASHVIEITVTGKPSGGASTGLKVTTARDNPAAPGAVTGTATYASFLSSLIAAAGDVVRMPTAAAAATAAAGGSTAAAAATAPAAGGAGGGDWLQLC